MDGKDLEAYEKLLTELIKRQIEVGWTSLYVILGSSVFPLVYRLHVISYANQEVTLGCYHIYRNCFPSSVCERLVSIIMFQC